MTTPEFRSPFRLPAQGAPALFPAALLTLAAVTAGGLLAPLPPAAASESAPYHLVQVSRIAPDPARWVARGFGLLAYGSGAAVILAPQGDPRGPSVRLALSHAVTGGLILADVICLVQEGEGLRFFRISNPDSPKDLGVFPLPSTGLHVAQWGDDLLVAADGFGLKVMAADPGFFMGTCPHGCAYTSTAPALREVGFLPMNGTFTALAVSGNTAYVAVKDGGIEMVDLAVPGRPEPAGRIPLNEPLSALAVDSDGTLIAAGASGIRLRPRAIEGEAWPAAALAIPASDLLLQGRALYAAGASGVFLLRAESGKASTVDVDVGNIFFRPSTVSLNEGDTVKWNWVGGIHSSTSGSCPGGNCTPDGKWDSGVKSAGSFSRTFSSSGTFPYFCSIHLASMTGEVDVAGSAALAAFASASPASGGAPLAVNFTGSASGGTAPYTYAWDFGDGTSSTEQNPPHTYSASGSYPVTLTVTDATSATASDGHLTIVVSPVPHPVINAVRKLGSPFRLKVEGSDFANGCTVQINGLPVPSTKFKSASLLIAKSGKALKAMVPKGQTVTITVANPDGTVSQGFGFSWTASAGGGGGGGGGYGKRSFPPMHSGDTLPPF